MAFGTRAVRAGLFSQIFERECVRVLFSNLKTNF